MSFTVTQGVLRPEDYVKDNLSCILNQSEFKLSPQMLSVRENGSGVKFGSPFRTPVNMKDFSFEPRTLRKEKFNDDIDQNEQTEKEHLRIITNYFDETLDKKDEQ